MSTAAQVIANIQNAQSSTGPRTDKGKATSSRNSLKHGLTAQTVVLPMEDEAAYKLLCAEAFDSWQPIYEPEKLLVQRLCDLQWRLARCPRLEASILDADIPDFKALDNISKHEARLQKAYSTTLKECREVIDARMALHQAHLKEAMAIRKADLRAGRTTNPEEHGFVFPLELIDRAIRQENARDAAINDKVFGRG